MIEEQNPYMKYIVIFLMGLILLFSVLLFVLPKHSFSEDENRYLEKFPKFSFETIQNGNFTKGLENYTSDHFPFRRQFLTTKTKTERILGKKENKNVYIGKDQYLIEKYTKMEEKNMKKIISSLNNFRKAKENITIQLMLIPTSITINEDKLPNITLPSHQLEDMKRITENLEGIDVIDVYSELIKGKKTNQIFYRLDHHWTTYGAYYGYTAFAKKNNIEPIPLTSWNKKEVTNQFNGTLYSKANVSGYQSDSIDILEPKQQSSYDISYVYEKKQTKTFYEESYLSKKDKYAYFLDGNHPLIEITNKNQQTGNLLVIKDSYANSFVPLVSEHYHKIFVIDPRFYKYSIIEYINQNSIDHVLFLYNMNTIEKDLGIISIH